MLSGLVQEHYLQGYLEVVALQADLPSLEIIPNFGK
jgi:hypothetical protein